MDCDAKALKIQTFFFPNRGKTDTAREDCIEGGLGVTCQSHPQAVFHCDPENIVSKAPFSLSQLYLGWLPTCF